MKVKVTHTAQPIVTKYNEWKGFYFQIKALVDSYTYNLKVDPDMSFCEFARTKVKITFTLGSLP